MYHRKREEKTHPLVIVEGYLSNCHIARFLSHATRNTKICSSRAYGRGMEKGEKLQEGSAYLEIVSWRVDNREVILLVACTLIPLPFV